MKNSMRAFATKINTVFDNIITRNSLFSDYLFLQLIFALHKQFNDDDSWEL